MQTLDAPAHPESRETLLNTISRLSRRLARERAARIEAEHTAETGLRDLYVAKRDLDVLCAVAGHANNASRADEILTPAVGAIMDATSWPLGAVYEFETPAAHWGRPVFATSRRDDLASLAMLIQKSPLVLETDCDCRTALEQGQVCFYSDLQDDPVPFAQRILADRAGMRLSVLVPVRSRNRLVAVMRFLSPSSDSDRPRLIALLAQIADHVARVYERQHLTDQLIYDALHDPLTGLANRQLFVDRLGRAARVHNAGGGNYSVLFLDLDRFKGVNDTLGHAAGDTLLIEVASRIVQTVARHRIVPEPTIARVGGDEFCILIENETGPDCAIGLKLAHDLTAQIARPFMLESERAQIGVSIGVAPSVAEFSNGDLVLKSADKAMYGAKSKGRGTVQLYDQRFRQHDTQRDHLIRCLREAIADDFRGFSLAFQPIVDLEMGTLSGFEALLRFMDGEGTAFLPDEFIPLVEDQGLIEALGRFVLDKALDAQSRFKACTFRGRNLSISINVSPLQLTPSFPDILRELIDRHGSDPAYVALELTENVVIDQSQTTAQVLDELRALGVNISIDDFGSGYATFGTLRDFSFKTLKIDRSFVAAMMGQNGAQIVKAIIEMGRGLGVSVIAEGIETPEQAERLRELGCSNAQGYHFSYPLSFDEAISNVIQSGMLGKPQAA